MLVVFFEVGGVVDWGNRRLAPNADEKIVHGVDCEHVASESDGVDELLTEANGYLLRDENDKRHFEGGLWRRTIPLGRESAIFLPF